MSLIKQFDEQAAELVAIDAIETAILHGADQGLMMLGSPSDPVRLKAAISILVMENRYQEAADLLEGRPCLLYTSPSPRDGLLSRMPSSA